MTNCICNVTDSFCPVHNADDDKMISREEAIAEIRKHGHEAYTMGSPMGASCLYVKTGESTHDSLGYADADGLYHAAPIMAWLGY